MILFYIGLGFGQVSRYYNYLTYNDIGTTVLNTVTPVWTWGIFNPWSGNYNTVKQHYMSGNYNTVKQHYMSGNYNTVKQHYMSGNYNTVKPVKSLTLYKSSTCLRRPGLENWNFGLAVFSWKNPVGHAFNKIKTPARRPLSVFPLLKSCQHKHTIDQCYSNAWLYIGLKLHDKHQ
jgi:hypothetical protein